MSSHAYDRRSSGEDMLLLLGLLVVLLAGAACFLWATFHAQISASVITFAHWQMQAAAWFTNRYAGLDAQILAAAPGKVKIAQLWRLLHNVGLFFRYPAVVMIAVLAVCCLVGNAPAKFTRKLDLSRFIAAQAQTFPATTAYVERELKLTAPAIGAPRPADPALHLPEWVDRFARSGNGHFHEDLARQGLARQLGDPWRGAQQALPHMRAMFAVFALHASRRREEAVELLGLLSASLPSGRGEDGTGPAAPLAFSAEIISFVDRELNDAALCAPCVAVGDRHAYSSTALMGVLTYARLQAGVLAPGQFAFLKLVDRQLWYALHSLGFPGGSNRAEQPNPLIEALGCRDHWAAEDDVGAPLVSPSVDRAVSAITGLAGSSFPLVRTSLKPKDGMP